MYQRSIGNHFFVSHSSRDKDTARKLREDLTKEGIATWLDDDILPGEEWDSAIKTAITQSLAVLYLVSPASHTSKMVAAELDVAENYERDIIPLWIGGEEWEDVVIMGYGRKQFRDMRSHRYNEQLALLQNQLLYRQIGEKPESVIIEEITADNQGERARTARINRKVDKSRSAVVTGDPPSVHKPAFELTMIQKMFSLFWRSGHTPIIEPPPIPPDTPTDKRPYKGLSAFTYEDKDIFFGRQHLINTMTRQIESILDAEKHDSQSSRCLLVIGASGSGKSSVVMAGLLPRLQNDAARKDIGKEFPEIKHWHFLESVRPGERPMDALIQALSTQLLNGKGAAPLEKWKENDIREVLNDPDAHGLCDLLRKIAVRDDERVVLIIDQFEELFAPTVTTDRNQYTQFIDLLTATATEPRSRAIIILTLRGDFYDYILKNRRLYQITRDHKIDIPPMEREELRKVIIEPARMAGVALETDLVGDLLSEMRKQPEALPLLQFTLEELFFRREGSIMTRRIYEQLGGLDGAINRHAEAVYRGLSRVEQECAQELLTRYFIYLREPLDDVSRPGSSKEVTRRRVTMEELKDDSKSKADLRQQIVNTFVNQRLFTGQIAANESPIYEISHEALINSWERLKEWIDQSWETLYFHQRTREQAKKWQQEEKKDLLYNGNDFKQLQEAYNQNRLESVAEKTFYRACKREQERQKRNTIGRYSLVGIVPLLLFFLLTRFTDVYYLIRTTPLEATMVTSLQETGAGSLSQAVQTAEPGAMITFKPGLRGTIHLQEQDLVINKNLSIVGPADQSILITSGNTGSKIHILTGADVTFANLQLKDSHIHGSGFLLNEGMMTLRNCTVSGNSSDYNGGGIFNLNGTTNLVQTTIEGNTASGDGGGVYNQQGIVNLEKGSIIDKNIAFANGGGIFGMGGTTTVHNGTISSNQAKDASGGGIDIQDGALIIDANSLIHDNNAAYSGGGIALQGSNATIRDTSLYNNQAGGDGGGILVAINANNNTPSSMTIQNIVIAENPNARYFIGQNNVTDAANHKTDNISGKLNNQGEEVEVASADTSSAIGNPSSTSAQPQTLPNYLGTVNVATFCQKNNYSDAELLQQSPQDTVVEITCVSLDNQRSKAFAASTLCQEQYRRYSHVIDRFADYFDPLNLQCYRDVRRLGPIITPANVQSFCQSYEKQRGLYNNAASRKTAYDWKCLTATGQPIGFNVSDLCRYVYHVDTAFERLTNYYRPDGWECWAPN
jgi:Cdc6-like AAA superfamily ATPase